MMVQQGVMARIGPIIAMLSIVAGRPASAASWSTADGLPGVDVLVEDPAGWLWLGGPGGLYRLDGTGFIQVPIRFLLVPVVSLAS